MVEYIPCYGGPAEHWGLLPATRLASRKILIEQDIKSGQGQHSVYSVPKTTLCTDLARGQRTSLTNFDECIHIVQASSYSA
jgi:hypothetical protein